MKVLCVGGGGREHAIVKALKKSGARIFSVMKNRNPGIARASEDLLLLDEREVSKVVDWTKKRGVEMAIIGPEAPLEAGIVDSLEASGIPTVGPPKAAAKIELSKEFARELMKKYSIPGMVDFHAFEDLSSIEEFVLSRKEDLVIKPIGLTGGKGVKVMGEHLNSKEEVLEYAKEILQNKIGGVSRLLIEKKEVGEEFTLQAFSDGKKVLPMPAVQDFKRAYEGDKGPNTGGMGSLSESEGLLPFLRKEEYEQAVGILQKTVDALRSEGKPYKGILYGGFMLTSSGLRIMEFNARFGDPEAMNVLPLLETDFLSICEGIVEGDLKVNVKFGNKATVCKYVVPIGYGTKSLAGEKIEVNEKAIEKTGAELFYASVDERNREIYTTSSRSLAVLGIGETIQEAEAMCEKALRHVSGKIYMRHDIGKKAMIRKKVKRMEEIRRMRI